MRNQIRALEVASRAMQLEISNMESEIDSKASIEQKLQSSLRLCDLEVDGIQALLIAENQREEASVVLARQL